MKHFLSFTLLLSVQLFISCNDAAKPAAKETPADTAKTAAQQTPAAVLPPAHMPELKVAAYLIYADGSLSKFDVLNDKSVALWNVIIAGGDAEKNSDKVKLVLNGSLDSLSVMVKNGKKMVVNEKNITLSGEKIYQLKNTGCEEVTVSVLRNIIVKYRDTIPFRCGE